MGIKKIWSEFVAYFLRGVVFVAPVSVTVLLLIYLYDWIKVNIVPDMESFQIALVLVGAVVIGLPIIGYLGTSYFWKPIATFLEKWVRRVPLVNTIYSSTKDLVTSFFGDKKKFDKPVLVKIDKVNNIEKLGFITRPDLEGLGLQDRVAVYCPISYSMAGDVIVVPADQVTPLDTSSSEVMRFLLSGGLAGGNNH